MYSKITDDYEIWERNPATACAESDKWTKILFWNSEYADSILPLEKKVPGSLLQAIQ